jgi:UDP-N-acetylglucosamine diphosphorylase/glucosamine-1-phosphate N-acetyltransferase
MAGALILFDDRRARDWQPFALTRPAGELIFGGMKLVERAERALGLTCIGYLTSEHLADFREPDARPVLQFGDLPTDRHLVFWSARAVLDFVQDLPAAGGPATYLLDGRPVGLYAPAGRVPEAGVLEELESAADSEQIEVEGRLLERTWELVLETPEQLARDLDSARAKKPRLPDGVYQQGDGALSLGRDVRIEPGALFDTRDGPVQVGDEVEIRAGTRLAGPALVGARSRLLGGSFEKIVTGPYSYLRGEVADTIVLGYANKAHDGHLGHSYLGRWVNLGASTTNSDLKNNYRPVRIWTPEGVVDSGQLKIGCFLGDHVKTGIGALLGTGTVVGAGANIYGSAMPPTYVPPFSWGEGDDLGEYRLAEFLDSAEKAMDRRGIALGEQGRRYLESCWRRGRQG